MTISERGTEILRKFVFLTMFEKWQKWGKFGFAYTIVFDQTSKRGHILTKTVFHPKVSQHLNYVFLLFCSILGEIHRDLFFLVKKVTKRALKYSVSLFFLPCLKKANPAVNLDLFKQLFLIKPVKGDTY